MNNGKDRYSQPAILIGEYSDSCFISHGGITCWPVGARAPRSQGNYPGLNQNDASYQRYGNRRQIIGG